MRNAVLLIGLLLPLSPGMFRGLIACLPLQCSGGKAEVSLKQACQPRKGSWLSIVSASQDFKTKTQLSTRFSALIENLTLVAHFTVLGKTIQIYVPHTCLKRQLVCLVHHFCSLL